MDGPATSTTLGVPAVGDDAPHPVNSSSATTAYVVPGSPFKVLPLLGRARDQLLSRARALFPSWALVGGVRWSGWRRIRRRRMRR